jgi:heme a synthase
LDHPRNIFLRRFSIATLVAIFLVVIAGGVVRTTGSGMGCPDWPKCFGQYIPPTSVDELPENYKDVYSEKRADKIEKFAIYLEKLGLSKKAEQLRSDDSLLEEQDFNAVQTWTEYINRLVGALSGFLMLICLILSLFAKHNRGALVFIAIIQLVVTFFQAWMGSIVVATNLMPWVLTIHMLLAAVIIFIQILHIRKTYNKPLKIRVSRAFRNILGFAILLSVIQIIAGTQVRQQIDDVMYTMPRSEWLSSVDGIFKFHRSFAILVVLISILLFYINHKKNYGFNRVIILLFVILVEALSGIVLSYFDMPAAMQPTHLLFSFFIISIQFSLFVKLKLS